MSNSRWEESAAWEQFPRKKKKIGSYLSMRGGPLETRNQKKKIFLENNADIYY